MSATDDLNLQQEWAKKFTLEQRVAALEHAIIRVQRHLGLPVTELERMQQATEGFKEFPPEFLEEMLELRMQVEEAKADPPARSELERQLTQRRDGLLAGVAEQFARLEALPAGDAGRAGELLAIRQTLNATKYVQGLLRDFGEE